METGSSAEIFRSPKHPYTQALLRSLPESSAGKHRLDSLPGVVPGLFDRPQGCMLNPRCPYATDKCRKEEPAVQGPAERAVKCHYPLNEQGEPTR